MSISPTSSDGQPPGDLHAGPDVRLGSTQAVRLVADREIRTRLRSKAYRITTAVLVVLVVAFALIMQVVTSHGSVKHVGVTGAATALAPRVGPLADQLGQQVQVRRVADVRTGRRLVADGDLDALLVGTRGTDLRVVVDDKLDEGLRTTLTGLAGQTALARQVRQLGGDPAQVATRVAHASVDVTALSPAPEYDPQRLAVGSVAGILVYLALVGTGTTVAQGVVEEKSSRVVELLLATVRPWQLMAGKVLGIGVVGLLQVAAVGVAGVVAGQVSGALDLSVPAAASVVIWLVVWFVLGFTLYALVFAGLGALVSRQEDVGGATAPAMMFLVLGYVVGISVLPTSPDNPIVGVMSLLPVFSPTLMPMRLAMGAVPLWQTALSLALAVASVPLLVAVTGRLYRNGVVRTGARVKLREALHG